MGVKETSSSHTFDAVAPFTGLAVISKCVLVELQRLAGSKNSCINSTHSPPLMEVGPSLSSTSPPQMAITLNSAPGEPRTKRLKKKLNPLEFVKCLVGIWREIVVLPLGIKTSKQWRPDFGLCVDRDTLKRLRLC